jgi:hypothetical protein
MRAVRLLEQIEQRNNESVQVSTFKTLNSNFLIVFVMKKKEREAREQIVFLYQLLFCFILVAGLKIYTEC